MSMDRAELAGTGLALAFHVALVAALSLHLAQVDAVPEPPAMEVELVDEVALVASAPTPVAVPPPASQAPETGPAEPAEPAPAPRIEPAPPPPRVVPLPAPRSVAKPAAKPLVRPAVKAAPARPAPRVSRIGDDFLKGVSEAPSRSTITRPAAATFGAAAKANVAAAIKRQIQPCADRQNFIGEGAERIRLSINLRLDRSGHLARPLTFTSVSGDDEENARFVDLVKDQARRVYSDCSPLRLPAELYQTPQGGWGNINLTYRVQ